MQDILRNQPEEKKFQRALLYALISVGYVSIIMYYGNSGEVDDSIIYQTSAAFLLGAQGIFSIFMFIGAPLLLNAVALQIPVKEYFPTVSLKMICLTLVIALSFMIINSAIGEWNLNLDFPDSDFEQWAKKSEEQLKKLTDHLVDFTSFTHFAIAIIVVAIIPAIGEELLFRGLIQNFFIRIFSNHHVAIWLSGFIFAAIHMQFYGVFPRMLLGVVFGYLYHWTGKLSLAMIAHFFNNGFALLILYLAKINIIEVSPEQMESSAPMPAIIFSCVVFMASMWFFFKSFSVKNE